MTMPRLIDLGANERDAWDRDGFFVLRGAVPSARLRQLIDRIAVLAEAADRGDDVRGAMPVPESALADADTAVGRLSKVFNLHRREPLFRELAVEPQIVGRVADLLESRADIDVDCFLSQFIFKHPGALGQPWHQDAFYFRMTPPLQIGVWCAVTEATLDNGPLWVVPGSHLEPIHESVERDTREHANAFYVEIQGADTEREVPVLLEPGDVLMFHSHLRHRSTDNRSTSDRAAMVYHYALAGTTGHIAPNHDWMPVLRHGAWADR